MKPCGYRFDRMSIPSHHVRSALYFSHSANSVRDKVSVGAHALGKLTRTKGAQAMESQLPTGGMRWPNRPDSGGLRAVLSGDRPSWGRWCVRLSAILPPATK